MSNIKSTLHRNYLNGGAVRRTRQCRVPTIDSSRETAVPCPLYHFGTAGIDIIGQPCPLYRSGTAGIDIIGLITNNYCIL